MSIEFKTILINFGYIILDATTTDKLIFVIEMQDENKNEIVSDYLKKISNVFIKEL